MKKARLISICFLAMFAVGANVFSANTITGSHNQVAFGQGGFRINPNTPGVNNPNSEFASDSSFSSSGEISQSTFSLQKDKSLKRSFPVRKASGFTALPTLQSQTDKDISTGSLFSIEDKGEFSGKPNTAPEIDRGEFSRDSTMFAESAFRRQ